MKSGSWRTRAGLESCPTLLTFAEACGFALQSAQIVKLGAAHAAGAHHVDVVDHACVDRENAFHALAEADLAHRDALAHAGVIACNHRAFEGLQTFLVAFLDLHVHANGVARPELGSVGALVLVNDFRQQGFCLLNPYSSILPWWGGREPRRRRGRLPHQASPAAGARFSPMRPAAASGGFLRDFRLTKHPALSILETRRDACIAGNRARPPHVRHPERTRTLPTIRCPIRPAAGAPRRRPARPLPIRRRSTHNSLWTARHRPDARPRARPRLHNARK